MTTDGIPTERNYGVTYGYAMDSPIDFWLGCLHLDDYMRDQRYHDAPDEAARAKYMLDAAKVAAREHLGWDGDFREGPYVFALPDEVMTRIGIAWKHDNKGTTFVFSPHPLPWLEKTECVKVVF